MPFFSDLPEAGHAERGGRKHSMQFNSKAGNLIPKLLCGIAGAVLVTFFLLNRKEEVPKKASTSYEFTSSQVGSQELRTRDSRLVTQDTSINSFPFSISKPIPPEGTEEDSLHYYNVNAPLEVDSIVDIELNEPEGADLALGVFNEDGTLAYANKTKNRGNESIRLIITNKKPITVAVETVAAPQTDPAGQYTLSVTSNPKEKGYLIESLPFTASRPINGQERIHLYQTVFPVDNGTIVGAGLKASENAELELYISDEKGTLNSSKKGEGKDEKEAALTFFNGGRASIIVETKNKEDSYCKYTLSVNTKGVERLIETLPYTASGYMSQTDAEGERWHWYQISSSVPAGTVVSANLSVTGKANMDVTIFVDRNTISYGANQGIGENEHTELTIEKDSKVYVIIDNVEGEGDYSLTVTSTVPTKP